MAVYKFLDVTEIVRKELNKVPGYKNRPSKKDLQRIKSVPMFYYGEAIQARYPQLKKELESGNSNTAAFRKKLAEENVEWLPKMNGNFGTGFLAATPDADPLVENLVDKPEPGKYTAVEFVLEIEGNIKPKLFGVSVPAAYYDSKINMQELFINVHFRRLPKEITADLFETDEALKPVDTSLMNRIPGRAWYPYGWDYLFFNLFTMLSARDSLTNLNFHAQMPFQSEKSGKHVITIFPVGDNRPIEEEKIIEPEFFGDLVNSLGLHISESIRISRREPATKKNKFGQDEKLVYPVNRASVSCNYAGTAYMLKLFPGLHKIGSIQEVYLLGPPPQDNMHNQWVQLAMAWAAQDKSKHIRVYSQPYPDFTEWVNLINNRSTIARKKPGLLLKNPQYKNWSYAELAYSPTPAGTPAFTKQQEQLDRNQVTAYRCYRDALQRSGFISYIPQPKKQDQPRSVGGDRPSWFAFDKKRIPATILQQLMPLKGAAGGTIAKIFYDYVIEALHKTTVFDGGLLGIFFSEKAGNFLAWLAGWEKRHLILLSEIEDIKSRINIKEGAETVNVRVNDKQYSHIKMADYGDNAAYIATFVHEMGHATLANTNEYILYDVKPILYPGIELLAAWMATGRNAFNNEVLARRLSWIYKYQSNTPITFLANGLQAKNIAKACYDFAVDNQRDRLPYYKQINNVIDLLHTKREKRILIGTWLQNFWTKDLIFSDKTLDEIIKREFNFAGDFLKKATDGEFAATTPNGLN